MTGADRSRARRVGIGFAEAPRRRVGQSQRFHAMRGTREDERKIWSQGFAHGQALSEVAGVCPYPRGSDEADAWLDGWYQGALKTDGLSYRDGPVTEPDTNLVWCHEFWH